MPLALFFVRHKIFGLFSSVEFNSYLGVTQFMMFIFFIFFLSLLEQIDSTWIVYNKPRNSQLTEEHAGFLMALGLSGHLNSLSYMNLHDYLCKVRLPGRAFARVTFKNFAGAFVYSHGLYLFFLS